MENLEVQNEQLNFWLDLQGVEYKSLLIVPESLQIHLLGLEDKVDENKIVDLLLTHLQGVIREIYKRKLKDHFNNENQSNCLVCSIFHLTVDALTQLSSDVLFPTTATAEEAKKLIMREIKR